MQSRSLAGSGLCAQSYFGSCAGLQNSGTAARGLWLGASARFASPEVLASPPPPLSQPPAVCGFQVDFLGGWLLLC